MMRIQNLSFKAIFSMKSIHLKKHEERRLLAGHHWIYSNEIDVKQNPLKLFIAGEQLRILDCHGQFLGVGCIEPQALLCLRLLSREDKAIDSDFFKQKFKKALQWRERIYTQPYYRLFYGDSDGVSGLVIDRFGDTFSLQLNTPGMVALQSEIIEALESLFTVERLMLQTTASEGSRESIREVLKGDAEAPFIIKEGDLEFQAPVQGQKTGWFYDHRENRKALAAWVKDKKVLDVFSYVGAWGLAAAAAGAREVSCVDSSRKALDSLALNVKHNQQSQVKSIQGDALDILNDLADKRKSFDVIILDPPAFAKKRKDLSNALMGYQRLLEAALKLLSVEGILVFASCSFYTSKEDLLMVLNKASQKTGVNLQIFNYSGQAYDHPIHPAIPETEYLKCLWSRRC